jgi:hypothetical protein
VTTVRMERTLYRGCMRIARQERQATKSEINQRRTRAEWRLWMAVDGRPHSMGVEARADAMGADVMGADVMGADVMGCATHGLPHRSIERTEARLGDAFALLRRGPARITAMRLPSSLRLQPPSGPAGASAWRLSACRSTDSFPPPRFDWAAGSVCLGRSPSPIDTLPHGHRTVGWRG